MATTDVNITITASGASSARLALDQAAGGLKTISKGHDEMAGKFQEKLQHVGLKLFAQDALRSIGLGGESRAAINMVNSAITNGVGAAGAAATALTAWVTVIGVAVGLLYKMAEAHKKHTEELQKSIKSNEENLKTVDDAIRGLESYRSAFGSLTTSQNNLLNANIKYREDLVNSQIPAYREMEKQILEQIKANILHAQTMHVFHAAWEKVVSILRDGFKVLMVLNPMLTAMGWEIKKVKDYILEWVGSQKLTTEEQRKLNLENDKFKLQLAEIEDALKNIGNHSHKTYQQMADDLNKLNKALEGPKLAHGGWTKAQDDLMMYDAQSKKLTEHLKSMWAHTGDAIAKQIGDSFAKMIVEGKSFTDGFKDLMKNLVEEFISDVIRMEIEWLAFMAISGGAGGFSFFPKFAAAQGFSGMVNGPTMFIAGEAGPEHVEVTPMSGGKGGGGGTSVGNVTVNVYGVSDPNAIADKVGQAIISRIRGRGDLNFARA